MASFTRAAASSVEALSTTIPPNPIMESFSPVFPRLRFSILPFVFSLPMEERQAGNKLIRGTVMAETLMNFLLFMVQ